MNVKTLCLGILHMGDATGYEINKLASTGPFCHFINASYGSIYPALLKLTDDGHLTWREETEPGNPSRKIYSITESGREELRTSLRERPNPDLQKSEFLFLTLFPDLADSGHLSRAVDEQIARLTAEIEMLEGICPGDDCASNFAVGYGLATKNASLNSH